MAGDGRSEEDRQNENRNAIDSSLEAK